MKQKLARGAGILLAAVFLLGLARAPEVCAGAVREGLSLCLSTLIPALFPFFAVSGLLTRLGAVDRLGRLMAPVTGALFRLPGSAAAAFTLGLLGGYPSGARMVRSLYDRGSLGKEDAERALLFCNNAGPAFFLGLVGPLLGNPRLGAALFGVHALSALLLGLFFRGRGKAARSQAAFPPPEPFSQALPRAVEDALRSLARVCAMVLLVRCAAAALGTAGPLPLGLAEVSSGILAAGSLPVPAALRAVLCSFLLGFGGLSVHAQTLAELRGSGLSPLRHTVGKVLHALLSAGLTAALLSVLPGESAPVFAGPDPIPWHLLPYETAMDLLTMSIKLDVFVLLLLLFPIFLLWLKNRWKNRRNNAKLKDKESL